MSATDWYMEAFGLMVSFSLYGDLLGISKWATEEESNCLKSGICTEKKASVMQMVQVMLDNFDDAKSAVEDEKTSGDGEGRGNIDSEDYEPEDTVEATIEAAEPTI